MDGRWQEPAFSLLKCEVTDEQGEEARMIHVQMGQNCRHHCELAFSLIQIRMVAHRNNCRYSVSKGQHKHIYFLACQLSGFGSSEDTLEPRPGFLIPFSNKGTKASWQNSQDRGRKYTRWPKLNNEIKKIVLDDNSEYKINMSPY